MVAVPEEQTAAAAESVGRSYTRGRRQPFLIRKWPGSRWTLPLGPYTLTQLVVLVGSVYLLVQFSGFWAHFGPLNLAVGIGVPVGLTYAARYTRIEGRDPLRAAAAGARYLLQPRRGYLAGRAWRPRPPATLPSLRFVAVDADLAALLGEPTPALAWPPAPARTPAVSWTPAPAVPSPAAGTAGGTVARSLTDLIAAAAAARSAASVSAPRSRRAA